MVTKRKECNDSKKHYVDKKELREQIITCKKNGEVSPVLAEMFIKIVNGVALRFGNLDYYGIMDDVKQDCLLLLLQKYSNFDPDKLNEKGNKTSPFSFLTTIVYNQMRYKVSKAKRQKEKVDELNQRARDIIERSERGTKNHDNSDW